MAKKDKKKEPEIQQQQEKAEEPIVQEQQQAPKLILSLNKAPMPDVPIEEIIEEDPIFLEPEEVDIPIYIYAPKHCMAFKALSRKQYASGIVKQKAAILLPDGKVIQAGETVKTLMKPELKKMLHDGVFLAGKAPRKEKGARKAL